MSTSPLIRPLKSWRASERLPNTIPTFLNGPSENYISNQTQDLSPSQTTLPHPEDYDSDLENWLDPIPERGTSTHQSRNKIKGHVIPESEYEDEHLEEVSLENPILY